jgi:hypothetical protein
MGARPSSCTKAIGADHGLVWQAPRPKCQRLDPTHGRARVSQGASAFVVPAHGLHPYSIMIHVAVKSSIEIPSPSCKASSYLLRASIDRSQWSSRYQVIAVLSRLPFLAPFAPSSSSRSLFIHLTPAAPNVFYRSHAHSQDRARSPSGAHRPIFGLDGSFSLSLHTPYARRGS